jgi:hypothetical protein
LHDELDHIKPYFGNLSTVKLHACLVKLLQSLSEEQPQIYDWIQARRRRSPPIELFECPEIDADLDLNGHSVYWFEIKSNSVKTLADDLLRHVIPGRSAETHKLVFGNSLLDEENSCSFGYIGQTSRTSPRQRHEQHLSGRGGAVLVESMIGSIPRPYETNQFRFGVAFRNQTILSLAQELNMDADAVTNAVEVILINLLKTANRCSFRGLNVDFGKRFGQFYNAAAAGRGNVNKFTPQMMVDLRKMFPDTGILCQNVPCENVLQLQRDTLYAFCQRCAQFNPTYKVARVVKNQGVSGVVKARDLMPQKQANSIRNYHAKISEAAFKENKKTRGVPFATDSLIGAMETIVETEGWKCSDPGCKRRRAIKPPKFKMSGNAYRWILFDHCDKSAHKHVRKWRTFEFNVNTRVWEEVESDGEAGRKRKGTSDQ